MVILLSSPQSNPNFSREASFGRGLSYPLEKLLTVHTKSPPEAGSMDPRSRFTPAFSRPPAGRDWPQQARQRAVLSQEFLRFDRFVRPQPQFFLRMFSPPPRSSAGYGLRLFLIISIFSFCPTCEVAVVATNGGFVASANPRQAVTFVPAARPGPFMAFSWTTGPGATDSGARRCRQAIPGISLSKFSVRRWQLSNTSKSATITAEKKPTCRAARAIILSGHSDYALG
jgi:hypothetical protein